MPVKIDYHSCNGCGTCYEICQFDIFSWDNERNMPEVAHDDECWHMCGACMMECPKRAIEVSMPISNW